MSLFMLDTDICSYIMKRSEPKLIEKLSKTDINSIVVSAVTEAELLYGIKLSGSQKKARSSFEAFIKHVQVLGWSRKAAEHYAEIRSDLHKKGSLIGANDLLIAAHALSINATLVTNNTREFCRIKDLEVENWTK